MNRPLGTAGPALLKPQRRTKRVSGLEPGRLRRSSLKRRKPIKRSNPERRAKKFERNFSFWHRKFLGGLPCAILLSRRYRIVCAHTAARGMGGSKGTWRDTVPLSAHLHDRYDQDRNHFEAAYGLRNLSHVLVVADNMVEVGEQLAAWARVQALPDAERIAALQLGMDLVGHPIEPPRVAGGEA